MANIYKGTLGLIGNTPLVEVTNIEKALGLTAKVSLVAPKSIVRSEGKAVRVIDKRKI